jgi:hypothetical protein
MLQNESIDLAFNMAKEMAMVQGRHLLEFEGCGGALIASISSTI